MRDAVIVGIDKYPDAPLVACVKDADDIAAVLSLEQYGFDCVTLFDERATRGSILQALGDRIYRSVPKAEMLVFYFAGHGEVLGSAGNLVTVDGKPFDPGISLAQLGQLMESASERYDHVVTILDCCHSGSAFNWVNGRPLRAQDLEREVTTVNESRCILAACRPDEFAYPAPDLQNGVFTEHLVDAMLGKAVNFDGEVTLLSLFDYVSRAVPAHIQTPVFKGDIAGTVVVGRDFPPRKGRPLETRELSTNVAKAQRFVDEYQNLQQRELGDRTHRANAGALNCAKSLEAVLDWFAATEVELPDIVREPTWLDLRSQLVGFRGALTAITVDQVTRFGRVTRHIGHGGYGHVWEVERPDGEKLAYKVFHGNELDQDLKVQRFENGYSNMRKLEGHPNVVRVYEMTKAPLGFVMDAIGGPDLRNAYIRREEPAQVLRLLVEVAETVQNAHGGGVKHRDIKPENIIVTTSEDGLVLKPWLTDFDLAYHETNRTLTTNLGVGGVINYAAPEQLYEPNTAAARAESVDVFSLGQLLFFVIVGRDPSGDDFTGNLAKLRSALNSWVDDRAASPLMDLYQGCTTKQPTERPDISEVIEALVRSEAAVLQASGNDSVAEADFCRKVGHLYAGLGRYQHTGESASMVSLSQQVAITIRLRDIDAKGRAIVEIEFSVTTGIPMPGLKSGSSARTAINAKLDKKLKRWQGLATRHDGKKGEYQVFVEVKQVPLTITGVNMLRDIMQTVVAGIEQW